MKQLTIHLMLNENSVLKAKIPQMNGQTISPSQKIRDSESDACCFPVPWRKQDILTVTPSVNTIRVTDSKRMHLSNSCSPRCQHHERLKAWKWIGQNSRKKRNLIPSATQTPSGFARHHPPDSTTADQPSIYLWCSGDQHFTHRHFNTVKEKTHSSVGVSPLLY